MSAASTSQGNATDAAKLLEEKEKDLELAAKIGQSLLEQNRELQNRNDFLEESLSASNDAIVQLRHELNMRMSLLHVYADYDDDFDACGSGERRSNVEHLQRRMKKLENENLSLRSEASSLKKHSAGLEEKERLHITECAKQLDCANEKISRLQSLIGEKSEECAVQSAEVERLLREVASRGSHEKSLASENEDLHAQLNEALAMHEELSSEIVELQERYTEVMSMLHDAEEELRAFRHNHSSHRAASADSLYDSLASELEASDSGFYSTISSARSDYGSDTMKDGHCLHSELEKIKSRSPREPIAESSQEGIKDIPGIKDNPGIKEIPSSRTRSVAILTDPLPSSDNRPRKISHNTDEVIDVPSALLAELVKTSKSMERPRLPSPSSDQESPHMVRVDEASQEESEVKPNPATSIDVKTAVVQSITVEGKNDVKKTVSEASSEESAPVPVWSPRDGMKRIRNRNSSCSSVNSLSKTASSDSLSGYEGPKMGEPGKPGTRDLDFSIRRLNVRRQVEREYARFRRERGLPPLCIPFFPPHIPIKKRPSPKQLAPSLSKEVLSRLADNGRWLQPWRAVASVGLLSALRDGVSQGVVVRSAFPSTPPSTPLIHRRYLNGNTVHRPVGLKSSGGLVEALGLCTPSILPVKPFIRQPQDTALTQPKTGVFTRTAPS